MASNEQIVNVPITAGLDLYTSGDNVAPPALLEARNCTMVQPGSLMKRYGFNIVESTPNVPATAFDGQSVPRPDVEAIAQYTNVDGSRAVLASGSTLYDYVGTDATHGWRVVNAIPEYVGTVGVVAPVGGSVIEVDSIVIASPDISPRPYRITAWITGTRTGQELTSDLAGRSQVTGDGNSVYYAVQDEATGAYVKKPTRLNNHNNAPVTSAINLRVVATRESTSSPRAFVAWMYTDATTTYINHTIITPETGDVPAGGAGQIFQAFNLSHRAFDVCGFANHVMIVRAQADTDSAVTPSPIPLEVYTVDPTTGVLTPVVGVGDVLDRTVPVSPPFPYSDGFVPWATRGIVLEQAPVNTGFDVTVGVAVRVIARQYHGSGETPGYTNKLDGQFYLRNVVFDLSLNTLALSPNQAYVPYSGFQTADNHNAVQALVTGSEYYSAQPLITNDFYVTNGYNVGVPVAHTGTNVLVANITLAGTGYTPGILNVKTRTLTGAGIPFDVTAAVSPTGTVTFIQYSVGGSGYAVPGDTFTISVPVGFGSGFVATVTALGGYATPMVFTVGLLPTPQSDEVYLCSAPEGLGSGGQGVNRVTFVSTYRAQDMENIYASGLYIKNLHTYVQDQPLTIDLAGRYRQVNQLVLDSDIANNFGFTPGIHQNVEFLNAGIPYCRGTVWVNPAGQIQEVAITDGMVTIFPLFSINLQAVLPITSITNAGGGTIAGDSYMYNITNNVQSNFSGKDVPDRTLTSGSPNPRYVSARGLEHCVHRWSVLQHEGLMYCGIATTTAITMTNPNGDGPYGAVSPHTQNNQFEIYQWDVTTTTGPLRLLTSGTSYTVYAAIAGPWRMLSGLAWAHNAVGTELVCAIAATGDAYQKNTFLVRAKLQAMGLTEPIQTESMGLSGPSNFIYEGNRGLFVESCNMMRTTSVPLNVPQLHSYNNGEPYTAGGLRESGTSGSQEVVYIRYEPEPTGWRKLIALDDYVFANGGVLSAFDGIGCNEASPLLWPQKDLTSINWPDIQPQVYTVAVQEAGGHGTLGGSAFWAPEALNHDAQFMVVNISNPWWKYQAGLSDKSGVTASCGWNTATINWGGDPTGNYETVYSDQRMLQFSNSSTFAAGGLDQASGDPQHYYGRYNANPSTFNFNSPNLPLQTMFSNSHFPLSYIVWAPRSAPGWGKYQYAVFNEADSGANFIMCWTYEHTDGTGRMAVSAPSNPITFTVCATIHGFNRNFEDLPGYNGGSIDEFRYGFFVPRMELTNRLVTAASDATRVSMQPYTTAEPFATVLYRMPRSNFLSPEKDFVPGRNETRGVVPYNGTPFTNDNTMPLGIVMNNFRCFDGPQKDFNGILTQPMLYTTGNVLDNVPPPACKAMCIHQGRLVIGGADDPTVVWYSKELTPTESLSFHDTLTLSIEDGGAVTGLASVDGALIIFKRKEIFVVAGTMLDNTGGGPGLSKPLKLLHGIGCIDHRSVIETPVGIFFQSERTLELLKPDFSLEPVGLKYETVSDFPMVTSVAHNPTAREIYFTTDSGANNVAVYNYAMGGWMKWETDHLGNGLQRIAVVNSRPEIACRNTFSFTGSPQAFYYRQHDGAVDNVIIHNPPGGNINTPTAYAFALMTAPFALHEVQGYERVKRVSTLVTFDASPGAVYPTLEIATFPFREVQTLVNHSIALWEPAELAALNAVPHYWDGRLEMHIAEQKNRGLCVSIRETNIVASATNPFVIVSGFACRIGLKQGFNKRTTTEAKH